MMTRANNRSLAGSRLNCMSDQHEAADFFRWLDASHRERTCQIVAEKYPGLSRQDVEDVWSETRKDLLKKWPSENGFDMRQPLEGLLRTIALRRACDMLRRLTAQDNLVKRIGEQAETNLASERAADGWWGRLDPAEKRELQALTAEAFRLLSAEEWLVLSVYCEQYPELRRSPRLLAHLNAQFPEVRGWAWTPADVRTVLNRARTIVQEYLREKGYDRDFQE